MNADQAGSSVRPQNQVTPSSIPPHDTLSDRRADIEAKQASVAALLRETGRDGLLLLEPENFTWITAGATPRGHLEPSSLPAVYCTPDARWLICSNVDTQRLFDEELDGLGFQLKEWPWHWGREQLLADLCAGRKLVCDRYPGDFEANAVRIDQALWQLRCCLSVYEQACLLSLGEVVADALETTCRTLHAGESERDIAGQIAHRLIRRGVYPLQTGVAVDGRSRYYRRFGFTSAVLERTAVLCATGRKYGLHVSASRTVSLGDPGASLLAEHTTAVKVCAAYLTSTCRDAVPSQVLQNGKRLYLLGNAEHEWLLAPQGHLTGRRAVEQLFTPQTSQGLRAGSVVTWCASVGAALCRDTYLVTDQAPLTVTPTNNWPLKRIRAQGEEWVLPDILIR